MLFGAVLDAEQSATYMVGPGNDVLRSLVPGDMDLLELEEDAEQGELVDYEEESPVEPLPMQEDQDDDRCDAESIGNMHAVTLF